MAGPATITQTQPVQMTDRRTDLSSVPGELGRDTRDRKKSNTSCGIRNRNKKTKCGLIIGL